MSTVTTTPVVSRADFEHALEAFTKERNGSGAYLAWAGTVHASTYELQSWRANKSWLERLTEIEHFCPTFPSAEIGSQVASALLMGLTLAGAETETLDYWAGRALSLVEKASDPAVRVMTTSVLVLNYAARRFRSRRRPGREARPGKPNRSCRLLGSGSCQGRDGSARVASR